ncbi:MAG: response regulator transcription factor [Cellulomonadaceae bacterium]|jgi:two-component system OmpR family response regulator|nr:response regulator transcription factor [Cellulomonadaceae bacterium]
MTTPANPQPRLVVVDDEPTIRELLATSLTFAGFAVSTAASGTEALASVQQHEADLIVLDVMMPGMDGFEVTRRLRTQGITTPVLFLTARDSSVDAIEGLTAGGDDYVTKPFSLEEVIARIHAILRRTRSGAAGISDNAIIRVGDLELNEDTSEVHRAGTLVDLSPTEFRLLHYLMDNEGRVVSKSHILEAVWQYNWYGDATIVESYISYLRRKLDPLGNGPMIHTKRGFGYMLKAVSS